ncbi:tyrosinase family protein [Dyella sp.]|uniref:tyrosinase family protein n=1 Tax=Dyella sp. TaxID=1869338 RepID=UPI002B4820F7|nr:tyrosinase family protein [Dyella sp.]HKT26681.1 tyrosinase family protein [Dyella sp.]
MSWQAFVSGPAGAMRLASLKKAVAKMRALDNSPTGTANFRRSWKYWANIHGYLGSTSPFGTVAQRSQQLTNDGLSQYLPYLVGTSTQPGIVDQTPPDAIAKAIWATCQHSPPGTELNFFAWHRMYLYYFERVLRWAANDPTLTLPYWDYTNPAQTALPAEFRDTTSPLYDWRRSPPVNQGLLALNPNITNIDGPLTTDTSLLQFEKDIESGVHGNVHCAMVHYCPISLMGLVGVAANDPIFYMHHTNIDRMWSCWQHSHPNELPGTWASQSFTFVDETGTEVTRTVKDFLDTTALGYVYDNSSACTRAPAPAAVAMQIQSPASVEQAFPNILFSHLPLRLNSTMTSLDVTIPAAARLQNTELVLRDVSAMFAPGALIDVYVAKNNQSSSRIFVATINWFGVFDHMDKMDHMDRAGPIARTFEYNVTRQLQQLGFPDGNALTIIFEASSGLVLTSNNQGASAEAIAASQATLRPDAKVTIGAIELRQ